MTILISVKLGLNRIDPKYFPVIKDIMKLSYFMGMLGGRKDEALYFIGYKGDQLLHLDPHYT